MLKYDFMRYAFMVGGLLAMVIAFIGVTVVLKRMSMIGDALSHVSLSGVTLALLLSWNPLVLAITISVLSALSIVFIQRRLGTYEELAIAIIMSFGIGLSGVLLGFIQNANNFNAYLFGSLVSINKGDTIISIVLSLIIIALSLYYYRDLFCLSFDEKAAMTSGVKVTKLNLIFLLMTSVTVAIASRIVGALVVSSLMIIPVALAMRISHSYKQTMILSVLFSLVFMIVGLIFAYYFDLRPGGTVVLTSVIVFLSSFIWHQK